MSCRGIDAAVASTSYVATECAQLGSAATSSTGECLALEPPGVVPVAPDGAEDRTSLDSRCASVTTLRQARDGIWYTKGEFVLHYGARAEEKWAEAGAWQIPSVAATADRTDASEVHVRPVDTPVPVTPATEPLLRSVVVYIESTCKEVGCWQVPPRGTHRSLHFPCKIFRGNVRGWHDGRHRLIQQGIMVNHEAYRIELSYKCLPVLY